MKFLEIRLSSKGSLFLTERELLDSLPPGVYIEGLKRGKAFARSKKAKERGPKLTDRDRLPF